MYSSVGIESLCLRPFACSFSVHSSVLLFSNVLNFGLCSFFFLA